MSAEKASACPHCGSTTPYWQPKVPANGLGGPFLLYGLETGFLPTATFDVVVCADCGLTRFFAGAKERAKLPKAKKWSRVEQPSGNRLVVRTVGEEKRNA